MKNLFNLDNPFMQLLARLGDLMILSIVTLALCIPVVTFGPAVTALFKTVYSLTLDTCDKVVVTYFRAFRDNFRQAVVVGLAMLLLFVSFFCDVLLLKGFFAGAAYTVLLCLVALLALLVLSLTAYIFPLIARYSNSLPEHLRNAAILMILNLPRTALMVLIHLSPLLMAIFRPEFMLQTLVVWFFLAPGLIAQADAWVLLPVFGQLEKAGKPCEDGDREEEAAEAE